jgi:hypothetical protein
MDHNLRSVGTTDDLFSSVDHFKDKVFLRAVAVPGGCAARVDGVGVINC